jgi:hypothetical protein
MTHQGGRRNTPKHPVIANLFDYIRIKEVRANTSLIGGKIIYNGQVFDEKEYDELFPIPKLEYITQPLEQSNKSNR